MEIPNTQTVTIAARVHTQPERRTRLRPSRFALVLILFSCLAFVPQGWAQVTGDFGWLLQFGTVGNDFGWAVHTDGDGNIYIAGDASAELPGQVFAGGALDAFVRKYDANGNELWTRQFGTAGIDRAFAVFVLDTNVYVGGQTSGTFPGENNAGGFDTFLRKYDANGNQVWTRQFGTTGLDEMIGIFADVTGVYVSGDVEGALPGQIHAGGVDAFIRAYAASGNELWTQQFGTLGRDVALHVSGDNSGIYAVGTTAGVLPGQTPAGGPDAFVRKYDRSGNELWTRQFGAPGIDQAFGVTTDVSGVYVAGRVDGALPGQAHAGGADAFVRKYDADGHEFWTRQFGTSLFDLARGVSVRDSVMYVSGPTGGANAMFPGAVGADVFVRAYTAKGKHLWTAVFGSALAEDNWRISAGPSGLYVTGSTAGVLPGLRSQGTIDAFIGSLVQEIVVQIDITPGSYPNPIRLGRPGVVPVAIMSSDAFDARTIDPATVLLEGASARLGGPGAPMESVEDVNSDGLDDLVVHIDAAALELTPTDVIAELTARTFGGRVVFGFDSIRVVP